MTMQSRTGALLALIVAIAAMIGCSMSPGKKSSEVSGSDGHAPRAVSAPASMPAPAPPPPAAVAFEKSAPAADYAPSSDVVAVTASRDRDDRDGRKEAEVANSRPQSGTLTAGDYDDLLNPQLYARYAERYLQNQSARGLPFVDTREAVKVRVLGQDGTPMPFAQVSIARGMKAPLSLYTAANGTAVFFPALDQLPARLDISVTPPSGATVKRSLDLATLAEPRVFTVQLPQLAHAPQKLDLLLTLDTTGSMTDELVYLQSELDSIIGSLRRASPGIDVRVGLIVYRDHGDEYVVRAFPFTGDLKSLRADLGRQSANGGGDYPEAVQEAFNKAEGFDWRAQAVKVLLHVADAPPHDEDMAATWSSAARLREQGVHVVPVAASGVGDEAQYLMRSMAALTQSRYLFLTDDSGVGLPHQDPDVPCYVVTRLDALIQRVLAGLVTGRRVEPERTAIIRTVGDYDRGVCLPASRGNTRSPNVTTPRR